MFTFTKTREHLIFCAASPLPFNSEKGDTLQQPTSKGNAMYSFVFHYNSFTVSDNEQTVFFSGNVGISQKQDSVEKN